MEEPLAVISNVAAGYVGRTNFDLLVYPDRLLSVKATTLRDMRRDALVQRRLDPSARARERLVRATEARVRDTLSLSEAELLARDSANTREEWSAVTAATLRTRARLSKLHLELGHGDTLDRVWMRHHPANGSYEAFEATLRQILGSRLDA
jgi:hypothetical protein